MEYCGTKKPKAVVKHIDEWSVTLGDSSYRTFKTEAEAVKAATGWEARALAEWEERNSAETKRREYNERAAWELKRLLEQLKTEAMLATKRGDMNESFTLKRIAEGIRNRLKED